MKLFRCDTQSIYFEVIELKRHNWRVLPPQRWQIALTLAGVIAVSILWALL